MSAFIDYGPEQPLRIVRLARTCEAHPAQWEGVTEHRADAYMRYRYGELSVHIGSLEWDWGDEGDAIWSWAAQDDRPYPENGQMTNAQLRARLPDWIVLPAGFEVEAPIDAPSPPH